jgi:hypothetical protein
LAGASNRKTLASSFHNGDVLPLLSRRLSAGFRDRGMMTATSQAQKCDPLDADVSAFHRNGHYFLWPHRKK